VESGVRGGGIREFNTELVGSKKKKGNGSGTGDGGRKRKSLVKGRERKQYHFTLGNPRQKKGSGSKSEKLEGGWKSLNKDKKKERSLRGFIIDQIADRGRGGRT